MAKRLSVILDDLDQQRLGRFFEPGTPERSALETWVARQGGRPVASEAAAIRALMRAGAAALEEAVLDTAYADLALLYDEDEADRERRTARDQYVRRTESRQ